MKNGRREKFKGSEKANTRRDIFFLLCYRYNLLNVMKTLGGFIRALVKVTNTRLNTRVERTAI